MSGIKAQKFVKAKNFEGEPKTDNFRLETEVLPAIKDGEFLCEALYLSLDPYMRIFGNNLPDGTTFMGEQVARVTESKNSDYPVNSYVCILAGWRTHTICDGKTPEVRPIPDMLGLSKSLALGVVGMPASTAYFGVHVVGELKDGETLFVNGAAGAVGSVVGQMAKIKGCRVIGTASSEDKIKWLKEIGFDEVINYKKCGDFEAALKKAAPKGIDFFYDNVGNSMSNKVMGLMNACGRVVVGGAMAGYNDKDGPGANITGALPYHNILMKTLTIKGFTLWQFMDRRKESEVYLAKHVKEGNIKYKEIRVNGFEKSPEAFLRMLKAEQLGKTVIVIKE